MRLIALVLLASSLIGCVSTKVVGGYDVYGVVIDKNTDEPIEGVSVSAHFSAIGPVSDNSEVLAKAYTDSRGKFRMTVPKTRLWGGSGGLAGSVSEWPSVRYSKVGYCGMRSFFIEPSLPKYQDMVLKLEEKGKGDCI